ncbi:MAG: branched-chain amino acid ABC transporter permease [Clostridia bacterium]|nr:branched-chain amino acid ABC transporter permease [Clostridia bacterium]
MKKLKPTTRSNIFTYGALLIIFTVVYILNNGGVISNNISGLLIPICAYVCMSISLNLTVGILGELSLGHAGFMSVGAFSGVIAASALRNVTDNGTLQLIAAIAIGAVFAAIAGAIVGVPVLRLNGDYLAIVTLAFGEIIKNLLNNFYIGVDNSGLHFSMKDTASLNMDKGTVIVNGPMGAVGIPKVSTLIVGFILILICYAATANITNSRTGRAIKAIRDNRIAVESVGISVAKYKLMTFVTSAAMAGMAGALYALNYTTITPKKFDFNTSILILVFVVLGGIGNVRGGMIAATVLVVLPELLRAVKDYRMLMYAVVLILVMIFTNNRKARGLIIDPAKKLFGKLIPKRGKGGDANG